MTYRRDPDLAQQEAEAALERAKIVRARGSVIAERWRESRENNNFRAMLRRLADPDDGEESNG